MPLLKKKLKIGLALAEAATDAEPGVVATRCAAEGNRAGNPPEARSAESARAFAVKGSVPAVVTGRPVNSRRADPHAPQANRDEGESSPPSRR